VNINPVVAKTTREFMATPLHRRVDGITTPTTSRIPPMKEIEAAVTTSHTHTPESCSKAQKKPIPVATMAAALASGAVMKILRLYNVREMFKLKYTDGVRLNKVCSSAAGSLTMFPFLDYWARQLESFAFWQSVIPLPKGRGAVRPDLAERTWS
jgi:hypothetical protein